MPIKTTKDGRTIKSGQSYTDFRRELYLKQGGLCGVIWCRRQTYLNVPIDYDMSFHVHHKRGRGMGGSKRDDTLEACIGLCFKCHQEQHQ